MSALDAEKRAMMRPFTESMGRWMLLLDPPEHGRLRALLNKAFTPAVVETIARGSRRR